jgi:hypothetical protein
MCTPVILADRFPPSTYDTPTSTRHVIIARAGLAERPHCGKCQASQEDVRRERKLTPVAISLNTVSGDSDSHVVPLEVFQDYFEVNR